MTHLSKLIPGLLLSIGFAATAHADSFTINVARVQMDLSCTFNIANPGAFDCSQYINKQGQIGITMTLDPTSGSYSGTDALADDGAEYALILGADANQKLQTLAFMRMQQAADGSMTMALTGSESTSLSAFNIAPLTVKAVDAQTFTFSLTSTVYAPAATSNMVTALDRQSLQAAILKKIQPALTAAQLKH